MRRPSRSFLEFDRKQRDARQGAHCDSEAMQLPTDGEAEHDSFFFSDPLLLL
jgi:hypothetical protein